MAQGTFTPLDGAFTTLTATSVAVDFQYSKFEALRAAVYSQATSAEASLYVSVQPGGLSQSSTTGPNDLCAVFGLLSPVGDVMCPWLSVIRFRPVGHRSWWARPRTTSSIRSPCPRVG